jgi:hypothetical protein
MLTLDSELAQVVPVFHLFSITWRYGHVGTLTPYKCIYPLKYFSKNKKVLTDMKDKILMLQAMRENVQTERRGF